MGGGTFVNLFLVGGYFFSQIPESKKPLFHYIFCLAQVAKAVQVYFHRTAAVVKMAPHLSTFELALVRRWQSAARTAKELWALHKADRTRRHIQPVCFSAFKKLLSGTTHRGEPETRGRKRKLGPRAVRALDAKRRKLVQNTNGEIEATWHDIIKKAQGGNHLKKTLFRPLRGSSRILPGRRGQRTNIKHCGQRTNIKLDLSLPDSGRLRFQLNIWTPASVLGWLSAPRGRS